MDEPPRRVMGNLALKVREYEKIILEDSSGLKMTIMAKSYTSGQVALYFDGPREIKIDRECRLNEVKDDNQLEIF